MTLLSAGITTGETLTVIDQFNLLADYDHQQDADGDVIQTTDTTHTADLPSWVDDNVFEATSPGYTEYLDTGAGSIDAYPSKGDANPSMYFLSSTTSGADYGVMYNVVDGNTFYEIHLDGGAQEVQFSKRDDDGTYSEFQSWSATISGGELYEIEFQHGDGTNGLADEEHLVRVTNVSDGTTLVDTTYTIAAGNELTVSDGFGVKFNGSGTMRAHGAAVNGDTDTSNGGGGSNGTYYTGDILYTSDYSGIQATIDAASATDTVRVDTVETVSEVVSVKSGIKVEGDGGKIQAADGSGTDILRPSEASNIWFDGLHIDGGWEGPNGDGGNVGTRCIGGVNVGPVDNIRITNCTIENSGLNAVNFVDKNGDEMTDIYIANNTIRNSRNHGILLGVRDENGSG